MNHLTDEYLASTFSICAYDPDAQEWGVAVESKAFIVGGIVPWAQAGVGAIATQAWTNMSYGPRGLALLKRGYSPKQVIEYLTSRDKNRERRQLGVLDARGRSAHFTGRECRAWAGGISEKNFTVQGNILAGEDVVQAMARAFRKSKGKLAERLLASLEAGQVAGGDKRGQQSAALLVVRAKSDINGRGDHYVDLRVDDHAAPIAELRRLYEVWERSLYFFLESAHLQRLARAREDTKLKRAEKDLIQNARRLAAHYPDDAQLRNEIAWSLAQRGADLGLALKLAREAAKLAPNDANILDTLAEVHFRRGEFMQALVIARALSEKNPERADLQQQLAKFKKAAAVRRTTVRRTARS